MLASPEFTSQVGIQNISPACDAVPVVPRWHLQLLLDVSRSCPHRSASPLVASPAPANHSGQVVPEFGDIRLSELIQSGSKE